MKAITKAMSKILKSTISVALLLISISCDNVPDKACEPNFTQGGFGALVTYDENTYNDFIFKVCYNENFIGSQVSIFGVQSPADIPFINASDARVAHMTDGLHPGDEFIVPFNNDDAWFVIYEDDSLGNFSNTTQILKGQFR